MVRDQVSGSRDPVLRLLKQYEAGRKSDAFAREVTGATIAFVEAYPNCACRELSIGHLTGSAWIVDSRLRQVLLTHHRKLGKWLQLGGHADGDLDLPAVALREAREESGLTRLKLRDAGIFDLDKHLIPVRGAESEHWHYDLRFLIEADETEPISISSESKDLAWVSLDQVDGLNAEESIQRMVRKTHDLRFSMFQTS